jgi:hypothetical protein
MRFGYSKDRILELEDEAVPGAGRLAGVDAGGVHR